MIADTDVSKSAWSLAGGEDLAHGGQLESSALSTYGIPGRPSQLVVWDCDETTKLGRPEGTPQVLTVDDNNVVMRGVRSLSLGLVGVLGVAACVFLVTVLAGSGLARASLWAGVLGAIAGVVAACAAIWPLLTARSSSLSAPSVSAQPEWVVERPEELGKVLAALLGSKGGTVGLTTGLHGAGGFGKTTLARTVRADPQVQREFGGGTYWITVGRDVRGPSLAEKVNDLIKQLAGENATYSDPEIAGQRLGSLMESGQQRLLVLDDVWEAEQLAPFTAGGRQCTRLVTTRVPGLLGSSDQLVRVNQMTAGQARQLLTFGLPDLSPELCDALLAVTGRWPLLLRLANGILQNSLRVGQDIHSAGTQLLSRLLARGPVAVDELSGLTHRLNLSNPWERARAVRATIEASTSLLHEQDALRFLELGVFAEDETIPFALVSRLWHATAGTDELQAGQLCAKLVNLALVSQDETGSGGLLLHDVLRDFLRAELGPTRLAALNSDFVEALAADIPASDAADFAFPASVKKSWWKQTAGERYVWSHLIRHMLDAGQAAHAENLASDLRWIGMRIHHHGSAAAIADLSSAGSPRTARLANVLARTAHLLAPTNPRRAVVDVLHSRIARDPDWGRQAVALREVSPRPRLVNHWLPPDLPTPALHRVFNCEDGAVTSLAISPNGGWIAASSGRRIQVWDVPNAKVQASVSRNRFSQCAPVITQDGALLVTAGSGHQIDIWGLNTGRLERSIFFPDFYGENLSAISFTADGDECVTVSSKGKIRTWQTSKFAEYRGTAKKEFPSQPLSMFMGCAGSPVGRLAVTADGGCLINAVGAVVEIWDAEAGRVWSILDARLEAIGEHSPATPDASVPESEVISIGDDRHSVTSVAITHDGSWLATGSKDGTVRIWDVPSCRLHALARCHTNAVTAVAITPDGDWLATSGEDRKMSVWEVAELHTQATPDARVAPVSSIAVPRDGGWLATADAGQSVDIWDTKSEPSRTVQTGWNSRPVRLAAAPGGEWLATTGREGDGQVLIWDAQTWQSQAVLTDHDGEVTAIAVSPDGSRLAIGSGWAGIIRVWDTRTWLPCGTLAGPVAVVNAIAFAPDGSWLASGVDDRDSAPILIWDMHTWKIRDTLIGGDRSTNVIMAAPECGGWLATANGGKPGVTIWETRGWQRRSVIGDVAGVRALAASPSGDWLAIASDDSAVRIWGISGQRMQAVMRVESRISACAWRGTSKLAVGGMAGLYLYDFLYLSKLDPTGETVPDYRQEPCFRSL